MQKRGKGRDPLVLFRLPDDERTRLYELCQAQGTTVSEFLRQAVRAHIDDHRNEFDDRGQYVLPQAS